MPGQANAARQTAFVADTLARLLVRAGETGVYFSDAANPTRATHARTETGEERPRLPVSGRERRNLNAHCLSQGHLD